MTKRINKVIATALSSALTVSALALSGVPTAYAASGNSRASQYEITLNGIAIAKPTGMVRGGTTYMPIYYVEAVLNQLGLGNSWNGSVWNITSPTGASVDLSNIPSTTGPYQIDINNTILYNVQAFAETDPSTQQPTTLMPIWYIQQLLHRFGIQDNWNGTIWTIMSPGFAPRIVNTLLNGSGAPAATLGVNGDFYLDTTADQLYGPKTSTGWGSPVFLIGASGSRGPQGATGATGSTGATGAPGPQGPVGPVHQVVGVINPDASQQSPTNSYTATVSGSGPYTYTITFPSNEFTYVPLPMVLALAENVYASHAGRNLNGTWYINFTVPNKTVSSFIATQITQ